MLIKVLNSLFSAARPGVNHPAVSLIDERLGEPLIRFNNNGDNLTPSRMAESILICAGSGSGKSTSIFPLVNTSVMRFGGSVVMPCVKPGDAVRFQKQAIRSGRASDVFVFRTSTDSFNPIAYVQQSSRSISGRLESVVDLIMLPLRRERRQGGAGDKHWESAAKELVTMAVVIFLAAEIPISYKLIHRSICNLPLSRDEVHDQSWQRRCPLYPALQQAMRKDLGPVERADLETAARELLQTIPDTPHRTLMSAVKTLTAPLSALIVSDIGRSLNSDVSTWVPDDMLDRGQILILDMPVQRDGRAALTQQRAIITAIQQEIIRRSPDEIVPPLVMLSVDEAPQVLDPEPDIAFMVTSRSRRSFMVIGIQSISALRQAVDEPSRPGAAEAIASTPGTKIFGASTDPSTMSFASSCFGSPYQQQFSHGTNHQGHAKPFGASGAPGQSFNMHSAMAPEVAPFEFTQLASGGAEHSYICEFFVSIAGQVFKATGRSSLKVGISQVFD